MTAVGWIVRAIGVVACLVAAAIVVAAPSSNAAVDCTDRAWTVTTTEEYHAAIACWNAATEPGEYSIMIDTAVQAGPSLAARPPGLTLTLAGTGPGRTIIGGVRIVETEDVAAVEDPRVGFVVRDLSVASPDGTAMALEMLVGVELVDIWVRDSFRGIDAIGPLTLRRVRVSGITEGEEFPGAVTIAGPTLIENSLIGGNHAPGIAVFGNPFSSFPIVIRNTIISGNWGGVISEGPGVHAGDGEVPDTHPKIVIDSSAIIGNDRPSLGAAGVLGGDVTLMNSTVAAHDGPPGAGLGVVAVDSGPGIVIANSTISTNQIDVVGPARVVSSIVQSCAAERFGRPLGNPVDDGNNVGACFGGERAEHLPLGSSVCGDPPAGCPPRLGLESTSNAAGAGRCLDVPVLNPAFLSGFPLRGRAQIAEGVPMLVAGVRDLDQVGQPRLSCDSGAAAVDRAAIAPTGLQVLVWDLDESVCADVACGPTALESVAEWIDTGDADVAVLHGVVRQREAGAFDRFVVEAVDDLESELRALGNAMLWSFTPRGVADEAGRETGTLVLSRRPIVATSDVELASAADDGRPVVASETIVRADDAMVRIVGFDLPTSADACAAIEATLDWIAVLAPMPTLVAGQWDTAAPTERCWNELETAAILGCQLPLSDGACADAAGTLIGFAAVPGSPFALGSHEVSRGLFGVGRASVAARIELDGARSDVDGDSVTDAYDNCPVIANEDQGDADTDGRGDACDDVFTGDSNCDGRRDIVDALLIVLYTVGRRGAEAACPLLDPRAIVAPGADVNGDRRTDVVDAVLIGQCTVGILNAACPP